MLQHVSKWVRQTLIILGMLVGLCPVAFAQTNLERGTYTLSNNVVHDNPVGQGMARSYTEEQSDLIVTKDGMWLTLGFNNTQYMGEFTIKVNGSQTNYETVYNSNNIKKLKFKIASLDASIGVSMHVVPMNTDVEYTVTLNQGSLKLIERETVEEVKPEEPKQEVSKPEEPVKKPESSNGTSSNNAQNTVKPSVPAAPSTENSSSNTALNPQSKPQSDNSTQTKEETQVSDENTNLSEADKESATDKESEENQEIAAESKTEELTDETDEKLEVEVLSEEEASQEMPQETETVTASKGNGGSMIIMIISLIALAGGLYYWYFKMKK